MKNLNSVDLNLLKVLTSIYRHRNLTKAGQKIGMSQPAMSRSLDRLNHIFGERLFVRSEGEMKPSSTTESIITRIEDALYLIESALNVTTDFDPRNFNTTIKLGLNDYCLAILAPQITTQIKNKAPNLNISIVPTNYLDASTLIHKGEINCAVVSSLSDAHSFCYQSLFEEDYVALFNSKLFPNIKELDFETYLSAEHLLVSYSGNLTGWIDEELNKMGYSRKVSMSLHSFSAVPHILSSAPFMCAVPRRLAQQFSSQFDLQVFELPFTSKKHTFYFVRNKQLKNNILSNWLRQEFIDSTVDL